MTDDAGMEESDADGITSPTSPAPEVMEEDVGNLEPLASVVTEDVCEDIIELDEEILKLVNEFGGGGRAYRLRRRPLTAEGAAQNGGTQSQKRCDV